MGRRTAVLWQWSQALSRSYWQKGREFVGGVTTDLAISPLTKGAVESSPKSLRVTLAGGDLVLPIINVHALIHRVHLFQLRLPVLLISIRSSTVKSLHCIKICERVHYSHLHYVTNDAVANYCQPT